LVSIKELDPGLELTNPDQQHCHSTIYKNKRLTKTKKLKVNCVYLQIINQTNDKKKVTTERK
jgi:hypothetical protein